MDVNSDGKEKYGYRDISRLFDGSWDYRHVRTVQKQGVLPDHFCFGAAGTVFYSAVV